MTTRREFVSALGAAAGAVPLLGRANGSTDRHPGASHARLGNLGLQLYTVRTAMAADFEGTLERVAQVGYKEVEFAGYFGRTPARVRALLERNRLTSPAVHVGADVVASNWPQVIETTLAVGHRYIVVAWTPEEMRQTLDDWHRVAQMYNVAAQQAHAAGLGFAYHNHSYEFTRMDGRIPYDILLEDTDPQLVQMEMDLYWITAGGQNPLDYFSRYPGRIPMVHVKDRTAAGQMVDVGAGTIDWRAIFAKREVAGIRHYFVEHDEPADAMASIRASYRYLSRLNV